MQLLSMAPDRDAEVDDSGSVAEGDRSPAGWLARYAMRGGDSFGAHVHDLHQISWSPVGSLRIEVDGRVWTLPSTQALWIPAGMVHDVGCGRDAQLHNLYVDPDRSPATPAAASTTVLVLAAGPLFVELIRHLADPTLPIRERRHAERVVLDLVLPMSMSHGARALRVPIDERAERVARALLDEPADERTIDAWGREVGASGRTLARHFIADTGLSFGAWRTQARLSLAFGLLDSGSSVAQVARRVGYRNTSAFSAAFRQLSGECPSDYLRRSTARPGND